LDSFVTRFKMLKKQEVVLQTGWDVECMVVTRIRGERLLQSLPFPILSVERDGH
jgi:hypothetical protein